MYARPPTKLLVNTRNPVPRFICSGTPTHLRTRTHPISRVTHKKHEPQQKETASSIPAKNCAQGTMTCFHVCVEGTSTLCPFRLHLRFVFTGAAFRLTARDVLRRWSVNARTAGNIGRPTAPPLLRRSKPGGGAARPASPAAAPVPTPDTGRTTR